MLKHDYFFKHVLESDANKRYFLLYINSIQILDPTFFKYIRLKSIFYKKGAKKDRFTNFQKTCHAVTYIDGKFSGNLFNGLF